MSAPRGVSAGPQWPHWGERMRSERPSGDPRRLELWAYAGRPSYAPGETLTLHVSTTARRFNVVIWRDGATAEVVHRADGVPGESHATPADAYEAGCGWPTSVSVAIPPSWRSGGYVVELTAADERGTVVHDGFFVVRPGGDAPRARIALIVATYTWQAYNDWGGASFYSRDAVGRDAAAASTSQRTAEGFSPRLSFDRPWGRGLVRLPLGAPRIARRDGAPIGWAPRREQGEWAFANGYSYGSGSAGWAGYDGHFVRWAERAGYAVELLSQWDLDRDPQILDGYACAVTVGHDEYWSAGGRRALDDFVERGGRYVRLGGNIFWQVRIEDEGRTQVCFKYVPGLDPHAEAEDRGLRTGMWESRAIDLPPVTTFGGNGGRGGYSRMGGSLPRGLGGFVVYRNDHWLFAGTDLYYGDVLGSDVPLVGYESDGVAYTFEHGLPIPTGEDGAPEGLQILALTPITFAEEDHGNPGGWLEVGEGDLAFVARSVLGADTPETREQMRRSSAVITWMEKGAGEVVCCGTTEWPYALSVGQPMVERITRNVLDRFSTR